MGIFANAAAAIGLAIGTRQAPALPPPSDALALREGTEVVSARARRPAPEPDDMPRLGDGGPLVGSVMTPARERQDHYDRLDWTPAQVHAAFSRADRGETRDLINLARSTRQKDSRLGTVCGTRTLVVGSREWVLLPPPGYERDREAIKVARRATLAVHAIQAFEAFRRTLASGIIYGHSVAELDWRRQSLGGEMLSIPAWRWIHANRFCWTDEDEIASEELAGKSGATPLSRYPHKFVVHAPLGGDVDYASRRGAIKPRIAPSLTGRHGVRWWNSLLERFGQPQLLAIAEDGNATDNVLEGILRDLRRMGSEWRAAVRGKIKVEAIPVEVDSEIHKKFIDWIYTEHSIAILGQNLTTEVKGGGSYAAAKALDNVRSDYLMSDLNELDETISDQLVRPLVAFNWPSAPIPYFHTLRQIREPWTLADVQAGVCAEDEYRLSRGYDIREPQREQEDRAAVELVPVGSVWTDTEDGHRLQVTRVDADRVYFVDLDSAQPDRQWSWAFATFLERCAPAEGDKSSPAPRSAEARRELAVRWHAVAMRRASAPTRAEA